MINYSAQCFAFKIEEVIIVRTKREGHDAIRYSRMKIQLNTTTININTNPMYIDIVVTKKHLRQININT